MVRVGKNTENSFLAKKRWLKKGIAGMKVWVCSWLEEY